MHILYARERKLLNTPIVICGAIFEFGCIYAFVIGVFQTSLELVSLPPFVHDF